jgi:hypothetical protein
MALEKNRHSKNNKADVESVCGFDKDAALYIDARTVAPLSNKAKKQSVPWDETGERLTKVSPL